MRRRKPIRWSGGSSQYSRLFGGADEITFAIGTLANIATGAITYGVTFRPANVHAGGLISGYQAGARQFGCNPFSDGNLYYSVNGFINAGGYGGFLVDGCQAWFIKPAGLGQAIEFHIWDYATSLWTDGSLGAVDPGGNIDALQMGLFNAGQFFQGYLVCAALFPSALSGAAIKASNAKFSFAAWAGLGAMAAGWGFGQDSPATPVLDVTGNGANEISHTNTSSVLWLPPGFSY